MKKVLFGKLSDGTSVHAFTLKDENVEVTLLDYGAIVQALKFKGEDVVLGYDTLEDYENDDAYMGAVAGRVCNRIKGAKVKVGKKTYKLAKNDGDNTLHGGEYGFSRSKWDVEEYSDTQIVFKRISHDMEEGFPGNLVVAVKYYICKDGLGIEYTAVTDKTTVISLTNHSYFNLIGNDTVDNMFLSINADKYTPIDKNFIPTGEILPVKDTPMDFKWARFIGRHIDDDYSQIKLAGGYDHNYVLNGEGFREVAVLSCARKNILMRCFTDMPGLQLYTGNFLKGKKGKRGVQYKKRFGLCLETQFFPNAVNEKKFGTPILQPNELYRSVTEYRFEDFMKKD